MRDIRDGDAVRETDEGTGRDAGSLIPRCQRLLLLQEGRPR